MLGVARPSVVAAVKSRLSCRCLCSTGRSGMDHIYDHIKVVDTTLIITSIEVHL